jgi:hypothetical protein
MKAATLIRKESKILNANNRRVRHEGQVYLVRCQRLGKNILADAEPMPQGGTPINLFARTKLSTELRNKIEIGNFS